MIYKIENFTSFDEDKLACDKFHTYWLGLGIADCLRRK